MTLIKSRIQKKLISKIIIFFIFSLFAFISPAFAAGNTTNDSFSKAKRYLLNQVYFDHHVTIYCEAAFDTLKSVMLPPGFSTAKYLKRAQKIEWEHAVPAENFGRTFKEWRQGDRQCVDSKGKSFKGRHCAGKVNEEYRHMEADMHNLFPAIGAVNAARSNFNFMMLPGTQSTFGRCDMHITAKKAQPPEASRGQLARAYLYMEKSYSRYTMSSQQRKLMQAWNTMYPVSRWECLRNDRISKIQGNSNSFVSEQCSQ